MIVTQNLQSVVITLVHHMDLLKQYKILNDFSL